MPGSSRSPPRRGRAPRSMRTARSSRGPSSLVPGWQRATPTRPHAPPGSVSGGEAEAVRAAIALQDLGAGIALVSRGIEGTIVLDEAGMAWRVGPSPERGCVPGGQRRLRSCRIPGRHRRRCDDRGSRTTRGRRGDSQRVAAGAGRDRPHRGGTDLAGGDARAHRPAAPWSPGRRRRHCSRVRPAAHRSPSVRGPLT